MINLLRPNASRERWVTCFEDWRASVDWLCCEDFSWHKNRSNSSDFKYIFNCCSLKIPSQFSVFQTSKEKYFKTFFNISLYQCILCCLRLKCYSSYDCRYSNYLSMWISQENAFYGIYRDVLSVPTLGIIFFCKILFHLTSQKFLSFLIRKECAVFRSETTPVSSPRMRPGYARGCKSQNKKFVWYSYFFISVITTLRNCGFLEEKITLFWSYHFAKENEIVQLQC